MSETVTPASVAESPPVPASEVDTGGSEETGVFAEPGILDEGGVSPGTESQPPAQSGETLPPGEQVPPSEQQVADPAQQPIPAKDDPSRYEFHQRDAQLARNELGEYKSSQLHAISQYIQSNPDMLDVVEDGMRTGVVGRQPAALPDRPVRPVRPANYEGSDAHDPDTPSGQFRTAFDTWQEEKAVYDEAVAVDTERTTQRNVETARLATIRTGLIQQGGLSEVEANEAMPLLFSNASMDPTMLAKLYRVMKAPDQDAIANQERARALLVKRDGLESPPPLSRAPGEAPPATTDADDYRNSMFAQAKQVEL